ncbi:16573_t:CDS:2 [Dentiscutata erythropus]|uniref:16573_t:CDS:1 n=1 Tax=Dentiscutata erythropus TaxID=1348616 RepID=A0A9N9NSJ0_9GLOM|nr:16573_t:CDS:2 [Dentiscutata erythropus]
MAYFPEFVHRLLEPIPQYVLGCLPAIAIVGASPTNKFTRKLTWVLRCLGCPFMGIFYAVNVGGNKESRCLFWLPVDYFIKDETNEGLEYRPVGLYTMKPKENQGINKYVDICTAKVSVLERLSPDWPYIPLLLSWTIPALWRRISSGNLVVKDPKVEFFNDNEKNNNYVLPWSTVLLAYFTPPIGYRCRSKYLTTICAIWSFNNAIAFLCHWIGEKYLTKPKIFHVWFSFWGFVVVILLLVLGLFSKNPEWMVGLFGCSCGLSSAGCPASQWGC